MAVASRPRLGRLPAVDHGQRALLVLANAPLDLLPQPALADVLVGNAVRELAQVLVDLVDAPAAAQVMADDDMEGVAAIAAQRTLAHDPFDPVDVVAGPAAIEGMAVELRGFGSCFCGRGLAAFAPHDRPVEHPVDIRELRGWCRADSR